MEDLIQRRFFLRTGFLIDGTGESVKRDVLVEVKNGFIASLVPSGRTPFDGNDVLLDFSGHTIIPCMIDSHVHLSMSGTVDPGTRKEQLDFTFHSAKKVISRHLVQHFAHGVVAARDGGDYAGHTLRYRDEILDKESSPFCLRAAGRAWRSPGRYGKLIGRTPSGDERLCEAILKENKKVDHVKIINSGLNSLKEFGKETTPQFRINELLDAVRISRMLGLKTMVHANGRIPVKQSLEAGCNSVEHGFFMGEENLIRMAETGATWVPTAYTMRAYCENPDTRKEERDVSMKIYEHQLRQIAKAAELGVRIAVGTDSGSPGVHHGHAMRKEIGAILDAGVSILQAIKYATSNGARLMGIPDYTGRLIPGAPATFVVLIGGPSSLTESLSAPFRVFIKGEDKNF